MARKNTWIKNEKILSIQNLKVYFPVTGGLLKKKIGDVKAVDDVSFDIFKGENPLAL